MLSTCCKKAVNRFYWKQWRWKINKADFNERLERFVDILSLKDFLYRPVRTLSLGQKMRAELSDAFLHDPEIVYLDEPTIGLDIFSKDAILKFIKESNQNKDKVILLTTHDLADTKEV
ncbi:MAG: hypothetical protein COA82_10315 [Alkaliphilus sp.]|nr:ATP-binding cassette domain-containing protein [bacterium AH-315-K05]MBN4074924.1 ATP-binding cassette domain-containing protein [bacterium AH-315-E09]PHS31270.1 MAG: hypothetical protein COA82_10315 [Alkaliphilus sp.]